MTPKVSADMPDMASGRTNELLDRLGLQIDPELLVLALTHRSFAHEAGGLPTNERLEFLGDSVLGIIVTDYLFRKYRDHSESELSKIRAGVVSQASLSQVARSISLGDYLLLGKGELKTGGRDRDSILCDTMEALIGAAYLSVGYDICRAMVMRLIGPQIDNVVHGQQGVDWRTELGNLSIAQGFGEPIFDVTGEGPDHNRTYTAKVQVGGVHASATGKSKRSALVEVSRCAYEKLVAIRSTS